MHRPDFSPEYTLQQLMPATGWRAVFHDAQGEYYLVEVDLLALASMDAKPGWQIVALFYDPGYQCWSIAEECGNYCALLRPGMTLAEHEELICRPPFVVSAEPPGPQRRLGRLHVLARAPQPQEVHI